jgi:probable selenium-dependent hydroxylase accessory protein YqeC
MTINARDRGGPDAGTLREALTLDPPAVICLVGGGGKTSLMYRLARELSATGKRVLTTTTTKISVQEAAAHSAYLMTGSADTLLERLGDTPALPDQITAARAGNGSKLLGFEAREIDRLWQARAFDWIIVEADGAARLPLKAPAEHEPVIPACCHCVVGLAGLTAIGHLLTEQWVFRLPLFAQLTGLAPGDRITGRAVAASLCHREGIFKGSPAHARQIVFLNQAETEACRESGRDVVSHLAKLAHTARLQRVILGQLQHTPPVIDVFDI